MSTVVTPSVVSPASAKTNVGGVERLIDERILEACRALWWAELTRVTLRLVIILIAALLIWLVIDQWIYAPSPWGRTIVLLSILVAGIWYVYRQIVPLLGRSIRPEYAARAVERDFPELRQSLTSYIALRDQPSTSGLNQRVIRSIGSAAAGHLRKHDDLPSEATGTMRLWLATIAVLAVTLTYVVASPKSSVKSAARLLAPIASIDPVARVSITDVDPGDTMSIAGRTIVVTAKISGMRDREQAMLRWYHDTSGKQNNVRQSAAMEFDPTYRHFSGRVTLGTNVAKPVWYTIEAGDSVAGPYQISVEDVPVVAIESIRYQPPGYTGESPWSNRGGAISALDGTRVSVIATTNRPVTKATIEFNPRPIGDSVQATAGATAMQIDENGTHLSATFPLRSSRGRSAAVELDSYRISVWDAADGRNPEPIVYPIEVFTDLPPDVAIMLPTKSPKELPIDAQQVIEVHASDPDYGLQQISLDIRAGIDQIDQPILWQSVDGATGNQIGLYRLRPTEHGLRIGDTISVVAVATDNRLLEHDPSVEPNTSRTDPIEIRIVASGLSPQPNDPEADGVSAPDDRPASEPSGDASQSGEREGQQAQGSGGSGDGAGEQQQDGEASGGAGSSGQSGATEPSENRSPDATGSNSGDSGQSNGEPSSGNSPNDSNEQPTANDASEQPADENADQGKQTSESGLPDQSESGPADTERSDAEPSDTDPSESATGQSTPDQRSSGPDSQGVKDPSASNQAQSDSASDDSSSNGQGENQAKGEQENAKPSNTRDSTNSGDQQSDSRPGELSPDAESSEGEANQPPQHDGEAMERIREYLENKQRESNNGRSGNQSSDQRDTGEPSESSQSDEGQSTQDQSGQAQSEIEQSQNAPAQNDQSTNQTEGDSGNESSPEQTAGDGKASKESQAQPSDEDSNPSESSQSSSAKGGAENATDGAENSSDDQQGKANSPPEPASESTSKPPQDDVRDSGDEPPRPSPGSDQDTNPSSSSPNERKPSTQTRTTDSDSDAGIGGQGEGRGGDSDVPSEQANPEYAKEATDMVLDYLEETRDQPDRELLDKLNWTDDDLKRFADRWQNIRQQAEQTGDPQAKRELNEALRSLGMKPKTQRGKGLDRPDRADALRDVRDTGNRRPPPAAYRDAFDAFRRAAGRN